MKGRSYVMRWEMRSLDKYFGGANLITGIRHRVYGTQATCDSDSEILIETG